MRRPGDAMTQYALPAMYALFIWWFSTGLMLYLDGRARARIARSMLGAMAVFAGVSVWALRMSENEASGFGVYVAFTLAILVWGGIEISLPHRHRRPARFVSRVRRAASRGSRDYAIGAIL